MKINLTKVAFRPFIYSFIITAGFTILLTILNDGLELEYFIGSLILFTIILIEIYFTANHYHIEHKKNTNAKYEFQNHKIIQYSHHIVLPSFYYIALVVFSFFNNQPSLIFLNLIITFFSFFILFENIHSFYKHKFSLHKSTNYIYDMLGVFLVFLISFDIVEVIRHWEVTNPVLIIAFFTIGFGINVVILTVRNSITKREILLAITFTMLLTLIGQIIVAAAISAISFAFIVAVLFRTYTLIVNHLIEHIIDKDQLLEDLVMLILVASLLNLYIS